MEPTTPLPSGLAQADAIFDAFIAHLRRLQVGAHAPKLYERFEPFALPDSRGRYVYLADQLGGGPIVLSFMRGGWCRFCRAELVAWTDAIPRLETVGGRFIAVSGEVGGRAEATRCELAPNAQMLCDIDHGVAMSLGLVFPIGQTLRNLYAARGLDFAEIYGNSGRFLPIPATFVIDTEGIVRFAHTDPDFRVRPESDAVITVVEACTQSKETSR